MRRHHFIWCALLLTALAAGGAHAQSPNCPQAANAGATADDRFLRFDEPQGAILPEPATLGMIALGGSAMFYPRRRARLYR